MVKDLRAGDDISIEITETVCGADHDGKVAKMHPATKIMNDDPANKDISRPTTIIVSDNT